MDHPVYTAAMARRKGPDDFVWIDTADCAKLMRTALATAFPGVKFSVKIDRYAGGSSITVSYNGVVKAPNGWAATFVVDYDGVVLDPTPVDDRDYPSGKRYGAMPLAGMPTKAAVSAVADAFGSARFDGMIDLGYSVSHWLLPDGSAVVAASPGTTGGHPSIVTDAPSGDAIVVHLSAGYIHVNDSIYTGPVDPADVAVSIVDGWMLAKATVAA